MAHQHCSAHHARIARTTNKLPSLTNSGFVANRAPCHAPRRVSPSLSIWKEHLERKPAFLSLVLAATLFSWAAPSRGANHDCLTDSRQRRGADSSASVLGELEVYGLRPNEELAS